MNDVPIMPEELNWLVWQKRLDTGENESLIAAFQHEYLAREFLRACQAVTDHYLVLLPAQ